MDHRRPTIADVARQAGVSKGLVSLVFNDRPGVAPRTRDRIRSAAADLGWRPDRAARSLSVQRAFAVGLVLRRDPRVLAADPFFPAFLAGMELALGEHGQVLVLSLVPDAAGEERTYRALAEDRRVDGVVLTDLRRADGRLALLAELGLPGVCVGRPDTATVLPLVDLDDAAGIRATVDLLVGLGHRRIAHVAGDVTMVHGYRRRASFLDAVHAHRLEPAGVEETDFSAAAGAAATARLLDGPGPPTAIVYASDPMAIAGMSVLAQRGLRVPEDCSVTGFDGSDLGSHLHPPLTTVVSDAMSWGETTVRVLLRRLEEGVAADVELPAATLLRRGSAAAPPAPPSPTPPSPAPADGSPAHDPVDVIDASRPARPSVTPTAPHS